MGGFKRNDNNKTGDFVGASNVRRQASGAKQKARGRRAMRGLKKQKNKKKKKDETTTTTKPPLRLTA